MTPVASSSSVAARDLGHRRLIRDVAIAALPVLIAVRFVVDQSDTSIALLMVLPIAIVAHEGGLRDGLFAGIVSSVGFAGWIFWAEPAGAWLLLASRSLVFLVVGGLVGWLAGRQRAEARLVRSVLDAFPAPASVKDRTGTYVLVNRALRRTLDRPEFDLVGRPPADGQPEEVRRMVAEADDRVFATGAAVEFDLVSQLPGGVRSVHHTIKAPVLHENGRVEYIVTIAYDITERVAEEEAALAAAAFEQESWERARRDYVQLVRHRLANPLTIIRAAADTLGSDYADDRASRRQLAQLVEDACRRIEELDTSPVSRSVEERTLAAVPPKLGRIERSDRRRISSISE